MVSEGDETFGLQLSDASGAAASGNDLSATATIADDDAVVPLPTSPLDRAPDRHRRLTSPTTPPPHPR